MITLNLLHPIEAIAIQIWKFESEPVIRIGRSGDNDVILYSSVVSRYHVELHRHSLHWEIVNIGANGTYINDQQIDKERVEDGTIFRLAVTGPKLQILLDGEQELQFFIITTTRRLVKLQISILQAVVLSHSVIVRIL